MSCEVVMSHWCNVSLITICILVGIIIGLILAWLLKLWAK